MENRNNLAQKRLNDIKKDNTLSSGFKMYMHIRNLVVSYAFEKHISVDSMAHPILHNLGLHMDHVYFVASLIPYFKLKSSSRNVKGFLKNVIEEIKNNTVESSQSFIDDSIQTFPTSDVVGFSEQRDIIMMLSIYIYRLSKLQCSEHCFYSHAERTFTKRVEKYTDNYPSLFENLSKGVIEDRINGLLEVVGTHNMDNANSAHHDILCNYFHLCLSCFYIHPFLSMQMMNEILFEEDIKYKRVSMGKRTPFQLVCSDIEHVFGKGFCKNLQDFSRKVKMMYQINATSASAINVTGVHERYLYSFFPNSEDNNSRYNGYNSVSPLRAEPNFNEMEKNLQDLSNQLEYPIPPGYQVRSFPPHENMNALINRTSSAQRGVQFHFRRPHSQTKKLVNKHRHQGRKPRSTMNSNKLSARQYRGVQSQPNHTMNSSLNKSLANVMSKQKLRTRFKNMISNLTQSSANSSAASNRNVSNKRRNTRVTSGRPRKSKNTNKTLKVNSPSLMHQQIVSRAEKLKNLNISSLSENDRVALNSIVDKYNSTSKFSYLYPEEQDIIVEKLDRLIKSAKTTS